ncbi:hypothetical protein TNCV_3312751 [Trichonephila clavipes]|nr:hypothetical protein TNCV_3312751 [Trichonephila clavipes]
MAIFTTSDESLNGIKFKRPSLVTSFGNVTEISEIYLSKSNGIEVKVRESLKRRTLRLLVRVVIILRLGQVMRTTPELAPSLLIPTPYQRKDIELR